MGVTQRVVRVCLRQPRLVTRESRRYAIARCPSVRPSVRHAPLYWNGCTHHHSNNAAWCTDILWKSIGITSTLAPNAWGIKACDFRPVTRHILQQVCLLLLSIYLSWKINDRNSDRTFSFVSLFLLSKCPLHTSFEGQSHFVSHEPPNILMVLPTHAVSAEFPNVTAYSRLCDDEIVHIPMTCQQMHV